MIIKTVKRDSKLLLKNILETVSYRLSRGTTTTACKTKIVFVCMGNICRSAFAEHLMKDEMKGRLPSIESCGLNVGRRTPAPREARIIAKQFGLNLESHLSRGWEDCDLESAELILAMEFWQYRKLVELFPHKKKHIKLLREFAPFPENLLCNINDPFGQSEDKFEKCFRQIKRSLHSLIEGQK